MSQSLIEHPGDRIELPPEVERCSCEEALALRDKIAKVRDVLENPLISPIAALVLIEQHLGVNQ